MVLLSLEYPSTQLDVNLTPHVYADLKGEKENESVNVVSRLRTVFIIQGICHTAQG